MIPLQRSNTKCLIGYERRIFWLLYHLFRENCYKMQWNFCSTLLCANLFSPKWNEIPVKRSSYSKQAKVVTSRFPAEIVPWYINRKMNHSVNVRVTKEMGKFDETLRFLKLLVKWTEGCIEIFSFTLSDATEMFVSVWASRTFNIQNVKYHLKSLQ